MICARPLALTTVALLGLACGDDGGTNESDTSSGGSTTNPGATGTDTTDVTTAMADSTTTTAPGTTTEPGSTGTTDATTSGSTDDSGSTGTVELTAQCLVTHNAGLPSSAAVVRVADDGTMSGLGFTTLGGDHEPENIERDSITACGDRLFFALGNAIGTAEFMTDGTLTNVDTFDQGQAVDGVVCVGEDRLFTYRRAGGPARTFIRLHEFDASGMPTMVFEDVRTFPEDVVQISHAVAHPSMPVVYLGVVTRVVNGPPYAAALDSLAVSPASIFPGQRATLSNDAVMTAVHVSDTADVLHLSNYEAGCSAYFELSNGVVPTGAMDILETCSPAWTNGVHVTSRSAGDVLYEMQFPSNIRIGTWSNGLVDQGTIGASSQRGFLAVTHDDGILLEVGESGLVQSYTISADGLTLTASSSLPLSTSTVAGVVLPCE